MASVTWSSICDHPCVWYFSSSVNYNTYHLFINLIGDDDDEDQDDNDNAASLN